LLRQGAISSGIGVNESALEDYASQAMGDEDYWSLVRIGQLPFQTKTRDQCPAMIIKILTADSVRGMGIGIVSPTEDARMWKVLGKKIPQPMDTVVRRPCFLSVAI